jgi:hypothetical protein
MRWHDGFSATTSFISQIASIAEGRQVMRRFVAALLIASGTFAGTANAAETWISCTPVEVVTYPARLHVRCAAAVGGISFFAVATQDTAYAARVLSVLTAAQVAGRTLRILYEPADQSGAAVGCLATDCRLIRGVGFGR